VLRWQTGRVAAAGPLADEPDAGLKPSDLVFLEAAGLAARASQPKFYDWQIVTGIRLVVVWSKWSGRVGRVMHTATNPRNFRCALVLLGVAVAMLPLCAQDLTPRAYVISPIGTHALILSSSYSSGDVLADPTLPLEDAKGTFQVPTLGYYQALSILGRSANFTVVVPYASGNYQATVNGNVLHAHTSGLADMRVRFAMNLKGGGAMKLRDYAKWHERNLIGVSLTASLPSGQYDPGRVINNGTQRFGFKPEIGFTRRRGHWALDWYAGVWFFTPNTTYYPGQNRRTQQPIGAFEAHLGYYVKPRLWVSADANFWVGGRSALNGIEKNDEQRNSRVGATASFPLTRRLAAKVSYSRGAYVTIGGEYQTVSVGCQYSWFSEPR